MGDPGERRSLAERVAELREQGLGVTLGHDSAATAIFVGTPRSSEEPEPGEPD
jgi:hypothetical protein